MLISARLMHLRTKSEAQLYDAEGFAAGVCANKPVAARRAEVGLWITGNAMPVHFSLSSSSSTTSAPGHATQSEQAEELRARTGSLSAAATPGSAVVPKLKAQPDDMGRTGFLNEERYKLLLGVLAAGNASRPEALGVLIADANAVATRNSIPAVDARLDPHSVELPASSSTETRSSREEAPGQATPSQTNDRVTLRRVEISQQIDITIKKLFDVAPDDRKGIFFGDSHGDVEVLEAMKDKFVPELLRNGVRVMFVEMVAKEDQHVLDAFMATGDQQALTQHLIDTGWDKGEDGVWAARLVDMLATARAGGIQLRGIDIKETPGEDRLEKSNPFWHNAIKSHLETLPRGTRFAVFGGQGHSENLPANRGVDALLGIPSLDFFVHDPRWQPAPDINVGQFGLPDRESQSTLIYRVK